MKYLITTIVALVLVGCGNSQQSSTPAKKSSPPSTKSPPEEFYEAAERDDLEVLTQNINDGVNINATAGKDGETALHRAATRGKLEAVKLLIEKGADLNLGRARDGDTPLDLARKRGHKKIAELLRKHGGKTGELANREDEGINDDLIGVDEDGDGFDAYDEKITGHSDNDPDDKPTQEEINAVLAELEAAGN